MLKKKRRKIKVAKKANQSNQEIVGNSQIEISTIESISWRGRFFLVKMHDFYNLPGIADVVLIFRNCRWGGKETRGNVQEQKERWRGNQLASQIPVENEYRTVIHYWVRRQKWTGIIIASYDKCPREIFHLQWHRPCINDKQKTHHFFSFFISGHLSPLSFSFSSICLHYLSPLSLYFSLSVSFCSSLSVGWSRGIWRIGIWSVLQAVVGRNIWVANFD